MVRLRYDGSMAGLLCAVFEAYERRCVDSAMIVRGDVPPDAFATDIEVTTDVVRARRVWNGLAGKLSPDALDQIYYCFLSGLPETERYLLSYVRYAFSNSAAVEKDFGHPAVLWVVQTARKVWREKHRMEAFVRFQEGSDGLFYALITPDYDVLPLIAAHFSGRYGDQSWIIFDGTRNYGIHYDKSVGRVEEVHVSGRTAGATLPESCLAADEKRYQMLWKDYFRSTGIDARKNPKLHIRHMPLRYWRHLTEKAPE